MNQSKQSQNQAHPIKIHPQINLPTPLHFQMTTQKTTPFCMDSQNHNHEKTREKKFTHRLIYRVS